MWIKTEYKGWTIRKGRCGWYGENSKGEKSPCCLSSDAVREWIDKNIQ